MNALNDPEHKPAIPQPIKKNDNSGPSTGAPAGAPVRTQKERNRMRAMRRRERETSVERAQRREIERIRAAARRRNESPTEKEIRRRKGRLRAMRRRENETEEESKRRKELNRVRMAERRRELKEQRSACPTASSTSGQSNSPTDGKETKTYVSRASTSGSTKVLLKEGYALEKQAPNTAPVIQLPSRRIAGKKPPISKKRASRIASSPELASINSSPTATDYTAKDIASVSTGEPVSRNHLVAIESLLSESSQIANSTIMENLASSAALVPSLPPLQKTIFNSSDSHQPLPPMLPTTATMATAAVAAAAAAAVAASVPAASQFNITQSQSEMHSIVANRLAMHKQHANIGDVSMMFQAQQALPQMVTAHPTTAMGMGTLPSAISDTAATFAPMMVNALRSFAHPTASLNHSSILATSYPNQTVNNPTLDLSSSSLSINPLAPEQQQQHSHPLVISRARQLAMPPLRRPANQLRYPTHASRAHVQEDNPLLDVSNITSSILHPQATAETVAAAAAAVAAATAPTASPVTVFHSNSSQSRRQDVVDLQHHPQVNNVNYYYYPQQ
ncbi:hypothetical protein GGI25_005872 [Coemansia spiralis]|uniref:Uncharacterized protein n=2 Tax=Coemansia TaxID=4863 RepID=A0A9W8KVU7_9FUNG|nr:hypothetical protein BX070DRAFT_229379 [Coemansia spiralis]KAJ1989425.1 hypothetical protein EDC05_004683 [Coemansia umbellata]KAJ2620365.1 hypothetical protein GGI26_005074 [Coemansia sp. RSA 1358]KAJ2670374.1 hypothetical protein GGI25_005872 [Coemansia spiralis]